MPVYGGEISPTCAWPSAVALGGCSGTLVHPEIVVYAAHCGSVEEVWFGESADSQGFSVPTESCMTNVGFALGQGNDYAFCKLAEPVTEVPFTPPLMGCETTLLTPGREVTLVGFGLAEDDSSGVKRQLTLPLNFITENDEAQTGTNDGKGVCFGDSGGPAFVRLPEDAGGDGSWRVFGIASYIYPGGTCGFVGYHTLVHKAVPWIEAHSGIDVTPCHYANGDWNPSPACTGFPLEPWDGEGKSWAEGCGGGPVGEPPSTCGSAVDDTPDLVAPEAAIVDPVWGERFDSDPETALAEVPIEAVVSDAHSGVRQVALSIGGQIPDNATLLSPPWAWSTVKLPPGIWTLQVVATDWAGNEAESASVVIGVDMDPPPMPPDDTDTDTGSDDSTSSGPAATSADDLTGETGSAPDGDTDGAPTAEGDESGCACRSQSSNPVGLGWLLLLLLGVRRTKRSPDA
jgi:MYXO-CTERM domain-containing protein